MDLSGDVPCGAPRSARRDRCRQAPDGKPYDLHHAVSTLAQRRRARCPGRSVGRPQYGMCCCGLHQVHRRSAGQGKAPHRGRHAPAAFVANRARKRNKRRQLMYVRTSWGGHPPCAVAVLKTDNPTWLTCANPSMAGTSARIRHDQLKDRARD